jgi:hypothetical protein
MSLGNCHFATNKNTFYIREIAKGDFRLYNWRFKSAKVYTPIFSKLRPSSKKGRPNFFIPA